MNKKDIIAIIPARSGSKGVKNKNIRNLGGFPLIAYSIVICKLSKLIERIIVSTDSTEIKDIALKFGAEVPFLRPKDISGDMSPDYEFMNHALNWFETKENYLPKFFVHIRPTTPLRDSEIIDDAIQILLNTDISYTSMRSAHPVSESPFKWFVKNNNYYESILKTYSTEEINMPRQVFPKVYIPNGYIDIVSPVFIKKNKSLLGDRILAYETPVCAEIDTLNDFEYIEYQLYKKKNELFEYLKMNYHSGV